MWTSPLPEKRPVMSEKNLHLYAEEGKKGGVTMAGLPYHVKFPTDPLPAPRPQFFPTMGRGTDPGDKEGEGVPPTCPGTWGGG
jgi:hypothetical protein